MILYEHPLPPPPRPFPFAPFCARAIFLPRLAAVRHFFCAVSSGSGAMIGRGGPSEAAGIIPENSGIPAEGRGESARKNPEHSWRIDRRTRCDRSTSPDTGRIALLLQPFLLFHSQLRH